MQAGCRISTSSGNDKTLQRSSNSVSLWPTVTVSTDSKALTGIFLPDVDGQKPLVKLHFPIGLGRAFGRMPASSKVFHPEAARREL